MEPPPLTRKQWEILQSASDILAQLGILPTMYRPPDLYQAPQSTGEAYPDPLANCYADYLDITLAPNNALTLPLTADEISPHGPPYAVSGCDRSRSTTSRLTESTTSCNSYEARASNSAFESSAACGLVEEEEVVNKWPTFSSLRPPLDGGDLGFSQSLASSTHICDALSILSSLNNPDSGSVEPLRHAPEYSLSPYQQIDMSAAPYGRDSGAVEPAQLSSTISDSEPAPVFYSNNQEWLGLAILNHFQPLYLIAPLT